MTLSPHRMAAGDLPRAAQLTEVWEHYRDRRLPNGLLPRSNVQMDMFSPATLPWLALFDLTKQPGRILIRLWGGNLLNLGVVSPQGRFLDELIVPTLPQLGQFYMGTVRLAEGGTPVYSEVTFDKPTGVRLLSRRLTVPVTLDGTSVAQVLTCQAYDAPPDFRRDREPASWNGSHRAVAWIVDC
ncbi:MAG TPA: hypothetical protein VED40_17615 [Azospirillaceae bacterium]|nr:hypothetical protein [Azospirillaceae bacterium]